MSSAEAGARPAPAQAQLQSVLDSAISRVMTRDEQRAPCLAAAAMPRSLTLDALMVCWGLGTWLGVNALYVQLPLLVARLPEGWGLPASMALAVQCANVGLLLYALLRRLLPRSRDAPYVYALLGLGALSLALNAFYYDRTAAVGGGERSLAFLALTFCAALVGCTSSVLFYPYLRHFRDVYLATYLAGEGLSGFVPSALALAQGVGGAPVCTAAGPEYPPPRFDTTVFLLLTGALAALSLASFTAIDRCRRFDSERVTPAAADKGAEAAAGAGVLSWRWAGVMGLMAVLNALTNGVLPSVTSYSCMPYGAGAYHLAVTLGAMANPAACLAGVWLRPLPARALAGLLAAALAPLGYILATALMSPAPPLRGTAAGSVIVVLCWVITTALLTYARLWVFAWARGGGARGMRLCGAATQAGSALGSLALFALVNYTGVFVQPDVCADL